MPRKLLIILGPTAVGKSDYAIEQALKYESPVISCDSRQIYREMRIGTAVPSPEQLRAVRHYFIQTHSVKETYTAGKYEVEALRLIRDLFEQGHETLVMAGGSGFYIDALCNGLDEFPDADPGIRASLTLRLRNEGVEGLQEELKRLDPQSYATIDISNGQRVVRALEVCLMTGRPFSSFKTAPAKKRDFEIEKIGLTRPRDVLYERIDRRVEAMIEEGLVEEARSLLPLRHLPALQTVGYRELFKWFDYLEGREDEGFSKVPGGMFVTPSEWKDGPVTTLERAAQLIRRNTRHYAKRQLSWWRRDHSIRWIETKAK